MLSWQKSRHASISAFSSSPKPCVAQQPASTAHTLNTITAEWINLIIVPFVSRASARVQACRVTSRAPLAGAPHPSF